MQVRIKEMNKLITGISLVTLTILLQSYQVQPKFDLTTSIERGKDVYTTYCATCHMEKGEGTDGFYPPLAKSDYMMADKKRSIIQVLKGATGKMKVNGYEYEEVMNGFDISDQQVSDVLNYVRNSFGNTGAAVTPAEVKAARK